MVNISVHQCGDNILNLTDSAEVMLYSSLEDLFFMVILPCIVVIGICGNAVFIFTVIRVKEMRTITNSYLVNIAAADMWFVGFSGSFYIVIYMTTHNVRNAVMFQSGIGCLAPWLVTYISYFSSMSLLTLATADKWYAICNPLTYRQKAGKGRTVKSVSFCWAFGILLGIPTALDYSGMEHMCVIWPVNKEFDNFPTIINFCKAFHPALSIINDVLEVITFVVILVANLYMYGHIIIALTDRPSTSEGDRNSPHTAQSRQVFRVRNQVARLLIINGIVFFSCQGPYRIISVHSFLKAFTGEEILTDEQYGILAVASRSLILCNSCCNPFIYFISSSYYRRGYRKAFCGFRKQDIYQ